MTCIRDKQQSLIWVVLKNKMLSITTAGGRRAEISSNPCTNTLYYVQLDLQFDSETYYALWFSYKCLVTGIIGKIWYPSPSWEVNNWLITKFPSFYGTRKFSIVFITSRHDSLSYARVIQSNTPPSYFLNVILWFYCQKPGIPIQNVLQSVYVRGYWNTVPVRITYVFTPL